MQAWRSEEALCAAAREAFTNLGWEVHCELEGWDLVIVSEAGLRIGIQAKLSPNMRLMHQAATGSSIVDAAAVLVPKAGRRFCELCNRLGISVIAAAPEHLADLCAFFSCSLRAGIVQKRRGRRRQLPPAIAVPAGVPSPRGITRWKLDAVRFCREHSAPEACFTAAEFRRARLGADPRRAVKAGWVARLGVPPGGKANLYCLLDCPARPDRKYSEIAAYLEREDAEKESRGR